MDAAYIFNHPAHCFLIYFSLCFVFARIVFDVLGEPFDWVYLYGLPFMFATILLIAMRGWARKIRALHGPDKSI